MFELNIENDYKAKIDNLRKLIKPVKTFDSAIDATLEVHAITHTSAVSGGTVPTPCDDLLNDLPEEYYSITAGPQNKTIAYHLWHIARIEDLVGNLPIAEQPQVFNEDWLIKLNVDIKDTGNAMTDEEIINLSKQINKQELINYRNAVGRRTREILKSLTPGDLKRKPRAEFLECLVSEGGLLKSKDSIWLKDFGTDIPWQDLFCCR